MINNLMNCEPNKICGWIIALSQLTVAACVLYVGYLANQHMENMVETWERTATSIEKMEVSVKSMDTSVKNIDQKMWEMNQRVGGVQRRLSPWRMMMP